MSIAAPHAAVPARNKRLRWMLRDYWLLTAGVALLGAPVAALMGFGLLASALALLLLMQCFYPALRYAVERKDVVPAIPILAAAFAIQFVFPFFFGERMLSMVGGFKEIDEQPMLAALAIANLAFAVFLVVVFNRFTAAAVARLPVMHLHLNRTRALAFSVIFGSFGLLVAHLTNDLSSETQSQLGALVKVLQNQALVAIGILAWLTYTSRSPWLRTLYYGLVAATVIEGLSSGFLEAVLIPVGIMFACQWIYLRRLNLGLAAALVAVMLLLNPVKGDFRARIWYSSEASASSLAKATLWLQSGMEYWGNVITGDAQGEDATLQLARRASMIDLLAHVAEVTPGSVPYLMGETYAFFAYSLVPRVLWPEKPAATANRMLSVQYGLTTPEGAERTTFGLSLVGEGYANFGISGAIGIMALMALVLISLQHSFATEESGPGGYALFMAFFIFFLNGLGSSAEIMFGNLLQSMIASSLLIYWVTERHRRR